MSQIFVVTGWNGCDVFSLPSDADHTISDALPGTHSRIRDERHSFPAYGLAS